MRSTPTAAISSTYQTMVSSVPAQEYQLGAEARSHRHQYAGCLALRRLGTRVAQYVQHRRRREVADLGERAPRQFQRLVVEAQCGVDRLEHLRAAGVRHP